MTVRHVEFIVEEPSMEAALRDLLPRLLSTISFDIHTHQCKSELLDKLTDRLRGYSKWLPDDHRVVVIVDRDDDDCRELKARMEDAAKRAGLATKSAPVRTEYRVVNRLAIEELEAWYFGDWDAVRAAYPRVSATVPRKSSYRDPDAIHGGTWEAFERIMQRAGYFGTGLRKIEAAEAIATHIDPDRNRSRSFQVLRTTLLELKQE